MNRTLIMGIQVDRREQAAEKVQRILTEYGCIIKTRLGLHETGAGVCSPAGLIVLEFIKGKNTDVDLLEKLLSEVDGVKTGRMEF